jgi:hypothetical protein
MVWEGFGKCDIDAWLPNTVQHFEQYGKHSFTMAAGSCKVNIQFRQLNNACLCIKNAVMDIKG